MRVFIVVASPELIGIDSNSLSKRRELSEWKL